MTISPLYPFSDLSAEEFQHLKDIARRERLETLRMTFRTLARWRRRAMPWPPRLRAAQVWPHSKVPALSPTVYL